MSKSGSSIDEHVGQIFIDIYICADIAAIAGILQDPETPSRSRGSPEPNAEQLTVPLEPVITPETEPDPPAPAETPEEPAATPEAPLQDEPVTYEQTRKVLGDKARNGYRVEVKALLSKYGYEQLSDIHDPEIFSALIAEAGEIGNG